MKEKTKLELGGRISTQKSRKTKKGEREELMGLCLGQGGERTTNHVDAKVHVPPSISEED